MAGVVDGKCLLVPSHCVSGNMSQLMSPCSMPIESTPLTKQVCNPRGSYNRTTGATAALSAVSAATHNGQHAATATLPLRHCCCCCCLPSFFGSDSAAVLLPGGSCLLCKCLHEAPGHAPEALLVTFVGEDGATDGVCKQ
jgi:hypothetical protein